MIRVDPGTPIARPLRIALVTTAVLVAGSLTLRVLNPFGAPPADVSDWVPHLWALGSLVLIALTHAWAPTLAWVALVVAAAASALASVGLVREVRAITGDQPVPVLSALVAVALVVPPIVAAAYATSDGHRPKAVAAGAWVVASVAQRRPDRRLRRSDDGR